MIMPWRLLVLVTYESSYIYKSKVKTYHDKGIMKKDFKPGQQV